MMGLLKSWESLSYLPDKLKDGRVVTGLPLGIAFLSP